MPGNGESIQVWVVSLAGRTAEAWCPVLSNSEWQKAMRFRFTADQVRSAVTRGVLKTLLGRYLAVPARQIEFTQNAFGKPAISGIEFNVSHSGDFALLAFSQNAPVGIDVEQIKGNRVVGDLAHRVLTAAEYRRFISLPEGVREQTFFEIWTLKESILKGIGSGLSIPPEQIEIAFYPDVPRLLSPGNWSIQNLNIGAPQYAAAIAVQGAAPQIQLNYFESPHPDSTSPKSSQTPKLAAPS